VQQFNNCLGDISIKAKGGRRRELMTLDEEKDLMKGLEDKALKGQILSYKDIKKIIETKLNKEVSDDFLWDLFRRNGWTKHSPRPQHPKKDKEKQDEFKKNSKTIWMPLKMILANH
jgi:transposase